MIRNSYLNGETYEWTERSAWPLAEDGGFIARTQPCAVGGPTLPNVSAGAQVKLLTVPLIKNAAVA